MLEKLSTDLESLEFLCMFKLNSKIKFYLIKFATNF
jgi:hypothetical protein